MLFLILVRAFTHHNDKWYLGVSAPAICTKGPIKLYENGDRQGTLVTHFLGEMVAY